MVYLGDIIVFFDRGELRRVVDRYLIVKRVNVNPLPKKRVNVNHSVTSETNS